MASYLNLLPIELNKEVSTYIGAPKISKYYEETKYIDSDGDSYLMLKFTLTLESSNYIFCKILGANHFLQNIIVTGKDTLYLTLDDFFTYSPGT